ncbi:hypothetical protein FNF27_00691 [Cafeteria roenbergensis]|uniref:Uncharacterized protein n=3 Tax=Cafeteria roenbergensis TaxID=33653 RepID=A0A5A8EJJ6_CAFRO|nr:hypothetical protein FNF27_00691 [Cafeteria roenbergensis]
MPSPSPAFELPLVDLSARTKRAVKCEQPALVPRDVVIPRGAVTEYVGDAVCVPDGSRGFLVASVRGQGRYALVQYAGASGRAGEPLVVQFGDSPDRLGLVQGGLALHEADGCASAVAAAADGCGGSPPLWLTAVTRARVVYFVALSAPASTSSADGAHAADGLEATALPQHASAGLVPCAAVAPSRIGAADHDGDEGVLCACCPLPGVALLALSSGALAVCSAPVRRGRPPTASPIEGSTDPVLAMVAVPPAWVGSPAGAAAAVWALRASGELELWLLPAHGELVEWGRRATQAHRTRLVGPDGRPVVWAANASLQAALVADGGGAAGRRSASQAGRESLTLSWSTLSYPLAPGILPVGARRSRCAWKSKPASAGRRLRFDVRLE